LKRALTDPRLFDGHRQRVSDEILHAAKLSPFQLSDQTIGMRRRLDSTSPRNAPLREWIDRLREEAGGDFPEKVTAFRKEMAVHGKYKQPCPVCGSPVQRIRYAGQRGELLRDVPDRPSRARRSVAVAPAEGRLAALARRVGSEDRMIETFLVAHPFVAVGVWCSFSSPTITSRCGARGSTAETLVSISSWRQLRTGAAVPESHR